MRKKNNNAKWNRVMVLLLSGVMVLGSAPVGALAAETDVVEVQVEESECEEVVVGEETTENPEITPDPSETPTPTPTPEITEDLTVEFEPDQSELWLRYPKQKTTQLEIRINGKEYKPSENSDFEVSFSSDDSEGKVVQLTKDGKLTPVGEGEATITVTVTKENITKTDTLNVVVKWPIKVEPSSVTLKEGETIPIAVTDNCGSGNAFSYQSEDKDIAMIDNGIITAKKTGETNIIVTFKDSSNKNDKGICKVIVKHAWTLDGEITEKDGIKSVPVKCSSCDDTNGTATIIKEEVMQASCTQPSKTKYTMTIVLGDGTTYENEEIEIVSGGVSHQLKYVAEKAATCKAKGNLAYYICEEKDCENYGKHFKDAEGKEPYEENSWVIGEKAHTFDDGKITTKATSTKEGVRTCTCKVCKQKVKYKIPRTAFTYKLGTKSSCIVSKVSDFKSIQLPTSSAYSTTKKAFTLDTKTWTLSPTKNAYKYYKSMKTSIPLTVTTKDGKKSTVKVNFQFPDPEVKITRTYETQAGKGVYRYTFQYDIPGATRIYVRLNTKNTRINNDFISDLKKYISKPKSDKESYIRVWKSYVDSVGKNGMRFEITAYYKSNKSRTITIAK
ncbi:MAG: Ig-like domain-containing protein [Eubacteriales bacterium]|nr:Ig-like domain-containing protein [Eubacteriales bacterium]